MENLSGEQPSEQGQEVSAQSGGTRTAEQLAEFASSHHLTGENAEHLRPLLWKRRLQLAVLKHRNQQALIIIVTWQSLLLAKATPSFLPLLPHCLPPIKKCLTSSLSHLPLLPTQTCTSSCVRRFEGRWRWRFYVA